MRELSLHILDILENSVRAGATHIKVTAALDKDAQWLTLCVEDNGPGLPVSAAQALDPFYTTKAGKRTGLGLSLFRAAAQQAGGDMALGKSDTGGARVAATFLYHHLDRAPLGDMAGTIMTLLLSNPDIHLVCVCSGPGGEFILSSREELKEDNSPSFASARRFARNVAAALHDAGVEA